MASGDMRVVVVVIAAAVELYILAVKGEWAVAPLLIGAFIVAWFSLVPRTMQPVARVLMAVSSMLGRVNNVLVLGALFFVVLTPLGCFLRVSRRDPLQLGKDAGAPTYWKTREVEDGEVDFRRIY